MAKRLIFTVTNDLTYDQRMLRICSALQEAGYNCELIGRVLPTSKKIKPESFKQTRFKLFFNKGKLFYIEYNLRLFCYLLFKKYTATVSIDCDTAITGWLLKKIKNQTFIFDAHELFAHTPEVIHRPIIQKIWLYVEKKAIQNSLFSYTVGNAIANYLGTAYGKQVFTVRNLPILNAEKPINLKPTNKFILYQGALNKGRGLENLILAMPQIPIPLKIAGEGDLSSSLRNMVIELNLQNKVEFLGFIEPAQLKELTQTAWLGYNVSEELGLSYSLSLNNKFFDYIHAELPSIVNPFVEYMTLLRQYKVGVYCLSSVKDIVQNINIILQNPIQYVTMKEECIKAKENLNWQQEKLYLQQLYATYLNE